MSSNVKVARVMLLILVALGATILFGCSAGGGGSSQPSAERQAPEGTSEAEGTGASGGRLGHPTLGSADAPVVLTEYSDYQ